MTGTNFCTSWSGGKDACFALWQAMNQGFVPTCLLAMCKGDRSSAHGLRRELLEAQAHCLGLPIILGQAEGGGYEIGLKASLRQTVEFFDTKHLLFGDIDLQAHRDWYENILADSGITPGFPLWHYPRETLLKDILAVGIETMIVSLKTNVLDHRLLGKILTADLAHEIASQGVCPTGEDGEFHTLVLNAPNFRYRLGVDIVGTIDDEWGYTQLDLTPA